MKIPSINDVLNALTRLSSTSTPSESHGLLCGIICGVGEKDNEGDFLNQIFESSTSDEDESSLVLENLYLATNAQLKSGDLDLQLLLPPDETSIEDRVTGLREWCQGFLMGLESTDFRPSDNQSVEVTEALKDLSEFAVIEYMPSEEPEQAEMAITEIIEFVRVAVLLIYTEYVMMAKEPGDTTVH